MKKELDINMTLKIKKLHPDAIIPKYVRAGDAAMDLYAAEAKTLQPNTRELVSTGIAMAIPEGFASKAWAE